MLATILTDELPLPHLFGLQRSGSLRTTRWERPMGLISRAWTNLAPPGAMRHRLT
jgi:hypothetical protein